MKILYINACVRECSRTRELAEYLLSRLKGDITEIELASEGLHSLDRDSLYARDRGELSYRKHAEQFAAADIIVIAAPYWDMSFPALLKEYIENICVTGITFKYHNDRPVGLCRAEKLYYVTTAGGPFIPDFGYCYIKALAESFYGIPYCKCFCAQGLDIYGADVDRIIRALRKEIDDEQTEL